VKKHNSHLLIQIGIFVRHRWNILGDQPPKEYPRNFALLEPMRREIANFSLEGKLKTSIEEPGQSQQELDFGS